MPFIAVIRPTVRDTSVPPFRRHAIQRRAVLAPTVLNYKLLYLRLAYKVLTTTQPTYFNNLISA